MISRLDNLNQSHLGSHRDGQRVSRQLSHRLLQVINHYVDHPGNRVIVHLNFHLDTLLGNHQFNRQVDQA